MPGRFIFLILLPKWKEVYKLISIPLILTYTWLSNYFIKKTIAVTFLLIGFSLSTQLLYGQKPAPEYQVKAAFLYNFTRFIDWPTTAFRSPGSPFVIGIIGDDPFGGYITSIVKDEKVGTHPITLQRYQNIQEVTNCHLLFINTPATGRVKDIVSAIGRRSILTVSDMDNFTKYGGMVRFYKENNKIRFEVNVASSKSAQLEISSKLLTVARITADN